MAYRLELTEQDVTTVDFVAGRYAWSMALGRLEVGVNELSESEAWAITEAFEQDTEGGHGYFPMLDPRSDLASKLYAFMEGIV